MIPRPSRLRWKRVQLVPLRDVNGVAQAFAKFQRGTDALVIDYSTPLSQTAGQICELALQRKLPTAGFTHAFANAVASRVMWKKRNGAFFWLMKCMTSRPPGRAATGGTRHGQGYQGARSFA